MCRDIALYDHIRFAVCTKVFKFNCKDTLFYLYNLRNGVVVYVFFKKLTIFLSLQLVIVSLGYKFFCLMLITFFLLASDC